MSYDSAFAFHIHFVYSVLQLLLIQPTLRSTLR